MTIDITNGGSDSATRQTRLLDAMGLAGGDSSKVPSTISLPLAQNRLAGILSLINQAASEPNGVREPADPSLCTLTPGGTDASLTNHVTYQGYPEKFRPSPHIAIYENGRQQRLHTLTTEGQGNIGTQDGVGKVGTGLNQVMVFWEFYTDAENIVLDVRRGSYFNIQIDGVFQSKDRSEVPDTNGANGTVLLNFPDKRTRKITINFNSGSNGFGGVYILPTDSVWATEETLTMGMLGDSFAGGSDSNMPGINWTPAFAKMLGVSAQFSAEGGTGILKKKSDNTGINYIERYADDLGHRDFDIICVPSTVNDAEPYANGVLDAGVDTLYSLIRQYHPTALILVVGSCGSVNMPSGAAEAIATEAATLARFESKNDPLLITVPAMTAITPPVFGSGNVDGMTGDGNADNCVQGGIHYGVYGHMYHAIYMADKTISAIKNRIRELTLV